MNLARTNRTPSQQKAAQKERHVDRSEAERPLYFVFVPTATAT
jgi:hypothetical protein